MIIYPMKYRIYKSTLTWMSNSIRKPLIVHIYNKFQIININQKNTVVRRLKNWSN